MKNPPRAGQRWMARRELEPSPHTPGAEINRLKGELEKVNNRDKKSKREWKEIANVSFWEMREKAQAFRKLEYIAFHFGLSDEIVLCSYDRLRDIILRHGAP
jgi:hypothetical protein